MITRSTLRERITSHLDGQLTIEDLAAWAEEVFRSEEFDPSDAELIAQHLATIRDAVDPHRFRWEEPDFERILEELED